MQNLNVIIQNCLNNDRKAQQRLYELHFGFLMNICYRYENNEQDALALVNKVYYKVLTKLHVYDANQPFLPWVKRIALNTAIDELRSKHRLNGHMVLLNDEQWEAAHDNHQDSDIEADDISYDELLSILNSLPEPERTVFNLYAIDELPHKEIAALLGISERSSKRHLRSARELLQHKLNAREIEMKGVS